MHQDVYMPGVVGVKRTLAVKMPGVRITPGLGFEVDVMDNRIDREREYTAFDEGRRQGQLDAEDRAREAEGERRRVTAAVLEELRRALLMASGPSCSVKTE